MIATVFVVCSAVTLGLVHNVHAGGSTLCNFLPCRHGGTCEPIPGGIQCICAQGYEGDRCQIDVDECSPNPCQNGGSCMDGVNDFTCTCVRGYSGKTCEIALCQLTGIEFKDYNLKAPNETEVEPGAALQVSCVDDTSLCNCETTQEIVCINGTLVLERCSVEGHCCSLEESDFEGSHVIRPPFKQLLIGNLPLFCKQGYYSSKCKPYVNMKCSNESQVDLPFCTNDVCNVDDLDFADLNWQPISDCEDCVQVGGKLEIRCKEGFVNTHTNSHNFTIKCNDNNTFENQHACTDETTTCDLKHIDFTGNGVVIPDDTILEHNQEISLSCANKCALPDCKHTQTAKCENKKFTFTPCSAPGPCCYGPDLEEHNIWPDDRGPLGAGEEAWFQCFDTFHTQACQEWQKVTCRYDKATGGANFGEIQPCKCKGDIFEYGKDCECHV